MAWYGWLVFGSRTQQGLRAVGNRHAVECKYLAPSRVCPSYFLHLCALAASHASGTAVGHIIMVWQTRLLSDVRQMNSSLSMLQNPEKVIGMSIAFCFSWLLGP